MARTKKTKTKDTNTFVKTSKENCLAISLSDLGITSEAPYGIPSNVSYKDAFTYLVTFTPTKQSHLGDKFDDYAKLDSRSTNEFLKKLFSALGITNIYLFNTFTPVKRELNNLYDDVKNTSGPMLIAKCERGVKEAIYAGIRNAIAHGNIIYDGQYYTFYSVGNDQKEYDDNITFLMRISNLKKLEKFKKTIEAYK